MPYLLPAQRMAFFFSPKAGGTSLRAFLFHVENGYPFREYVVQGKRMDANSLLLNYRFNRIKTHRLSKYRRFALVRDPVKRFLSGYSNRILHYRELSAEAAGKELLKCGLPPDPDLHTFVDNFPDYLTCSKPMARHFLRQQKFIGYDPAFFDRVFRLEAVGELIDFVNAECETDAVMPRLQTGGPKYAFFELDEDLQAQIVSLVQSDVVFSFFPDLWAQYAHLADESVPLADDVVKRVAMAG